MREQAERKVTVTVFMYSGYCFYSQKMTIPPEEAVYVICKSNMQRDGTSDSLKDASACFYGVVWDGIRLL